MKGWEICLSKVNLNQKRAELPQSGTGLGMTTAVKRDKYNEKTQSELLLAGHLKGE